MATRRIKDITNTATTFASDDFIALDGATQGTRKMDKDDLIAEVSAGVSGDYLEEANNLSDVASLDTSKLNMEIPDVGTSPQEVPLNGMLGTMAYQDANGVSMGDVEAESLEVTGAITTKDVGGATKGQVQFQDNSYTISGGSNLGDIRHDAPRHRFYSGATILAQLDEGTTYFQNTNVGIGDTSPDHKLTVDSGDIQLQATSSTNTDSQSINWKNTNSSGFDIARIQAATGGNIYEGQLKFLTKDSGGTMAERVRIDSSGRLGLGINSPNYLFQAEGAYFSAGFPFNVAVQNNTTAYNVTDNGSGIVFGGRTAASGGLITSLAGVAGCKANNTDGNHEGNLRVLVRENGASSMTESARFTKDGLVMGSGMAIDFGSGASTTLDAYEEGTHTATLTPQTSGTITLNSATDTIAYTKIGRMVTITGNLSVSAVSSPTGDFVKISLPFVVGNYDKTSGDFAAPIFLMNAAFAISSYRLIGIEGDSFLRIYRTTSTGVSGANTASDFSGNEAIYLSCTYQTTA